MAGDLAAAILESAGRLGVDPVDLGTAISYETAGTFDPWKAGPTTKWGQHRGLIQWGEPQRREFGVYQGMPVAEQMRAAEKYLMKAGVKPGHGLLDIYSAINAGGVGRYNRSDAAAGGAPGTVRDKVEQQMTGHRAKAAALLGGVISPQAQVGGQTAQAGTLPSARGALPLAAAFGAPQMVPVAVAAPSAVSELALTFLQSGDRQRQQQEQQRAEQARRLALFGADPLAGLFDGP